MTDDAPSTVTLTFSDHLAIPHLPGPEDAARAAAWCADRGHYDLAAPLMALASALTAHHLALTDLTGPNVAWVPNLGQTRDEQPRTPDAARPLPHICGTCGARFPSGAQRREHMCPGPRVVH